MSTLQDMQEHCDKCSTELEIGQIGLCDECQEAASEEAPSKAE